jgi:hypothetical protein
MDEPAARVRTRKGARLDEIVSLTDAFCAAYLNDEYRDLFGKCAREAFSLGLPLETGKAAGWAAGVISAVAYANFLGSDRTQPFHMSPVEMASRAGVSEATMHNRSKAIRDALGIDRLDPRFCTQRLNDENPLIWFLSVNGVPLDIRRAPRAVQEAAYRQGLIPYIPADGPHHREEQERRTTEPEPGVTRARRRKSRRGSQAGPARIYTLDVILLQGTFSREFAKKNRSVIRTIEIRGDQTLEQLHQAIFAAFDRYDPHMYEFQFGKGPMDPKGPRYVLPEMLESEQEPGSAVAGVTTETTIDQMDMRVGRHFGYLFAFGDQWYHQIDVAAISDGPVKGEYPRVTQRRGESPPQYPDEEE